MNFYRPTTRPRLYVPRANPKPRRARLAWALLLASLVLLLVSAGRAASKYICNSKRLSSTEVALSCENGADPTGTKIGQTLVISCGK